MTSLYQPRLGLREISSVPQLTQHLDQIRASLPSANPSMRHLPSLTTRKQAFQPIGKLPDHCAHLPPSPPPVHAHTPPAASLPVGWALECRNRSSRWVSSSSCDEGSFFLLAGCREWALPSRGRSELSLALTWKPGPTFPLDLSRASLSQNNPE